MFTYYIYDESGELMRKVRSLHEAQEIVAIRNGWNFVKVKTPRVKVVFEDAPF